MSIQITTVTISPIHDHLGAHRVYMRMFGPSSTRWLLRWQNPAIGTMLARNYARPHEMIFGDRPSRKRTHSDDGGDLIVRPLHHIENESIIRRIGERELHLGNWRAADPAYHDRTFDHVLSATSNTPPMTTHHCLLTDGPDNDWKAFKRAVDTARQLYRRDGSLLVHCTAGISRSSTLIATIAAEKDRQLLDALSIVKRARPTASPNPALHEWAVVYLSDFSQIYATEN